MVDEFKEAEKAIKEFARELHEVSRIHKRRSQKRECIIKGINLSWPNIIDVQKSIHDSIINPHGKLRECIELFHSKF